MKSTDSSHQKISRLSRVKSDQPNPTRTRLQKNKLQAIVETSREQKREKQSNTQGLTNPSSEELGLNFGEILLSPSPTKILSLDQVKLRNVEPTGGSSIEDHETVGVGSRRLETKSVKAAVTSSAKKIANIVSPRRKKSSSSDETQSHSPPASSRDTTRRVAYRVGRKLDRILKYLPAGASLDKHGNLSGKCQFTTFALNHLRFPASDIQDVIHQELRPFLKLEDEKLRPQALDGVLLVKLADADFHRLNYQFQDTDGTIKAKIPLPNVDQVNEYLTYHNYSEDIRKTAEEKLRSRQIGHALLDFVSDENATPEANTSTALVLSSLLTQRVGELLTAAVYGDNSPLKMASEGSTKWSNREVTIKDNQGQTVPVQAKQYGALVYTLSREGNDFKLAIDFPTYAEARDGYKGEIPLHENGVIGVHISTEIRVRGDAARNGELSITLPSGVEVEYSGRFTIQ
ncbi:hypothetical protein [Variovorax guangxiensis]|uniref:hypothetical protein n=1 Tax=Variovorax guangxiensis TaxID=1775474 RepID=UPI00285F4AD0|nr:hypothetical protein [Variovorax guangxiensis]MDR6855554.1 hypothetical protein [Variovorax guangxiensis]